MEFTERDSQNYIEAPNRPGGFSIHGTSKSRYERIIKEGTDPSRAVGYPREFHSISINKPMTEEEIKRILQLAWRYSYEKAQFGAGEFYEEDPTPVIMVLKTPKPSLLKRLIERKGVFLRAQKKPIPPQEILGAVTLDHKNNWTSNLSAKDAKELWKKITDLVNNTEPVR